MLLRLARTVAVFIEVFIVGGMEGIFMSKVDETRLDNKNLC